mmetsp:Transcript_37793/g.82951  ORF Transcript_37793/g.82951 Transcript_37793/m.82951 type:complete len:109 (+) Transcript_37793:77-403(+)
MQDLPQAESNFDMESFLNIKAQNLGCRPIGCWREAMAPNACVDVDRVEKVEKAVPTVKSCLDSVPPGWSSLRFWTNHLQSSDLPSRSSSNRSIMSEPCKAYILADLGF